MKPIYYDTREQPFMLVDRVTHTNHAIRPGVCLATVCGIYGLQVHQRGGSWKYQQHPAGEMNCLLCLAAESDHA